MHSRYQEEPYYNEQQIKDIKGHIVSFKGTYSLSRILNTMDSKFEEVS